MTRKKGLHLSVDLLSKRFEGGEATIEDLDFLDSGQGLHLQYDGYLVRVCPDSPLSDQIPKELAESYPEGALLRIDFTPNESERFPQVLHLVGVIDSSRVCHQHTPSIGKWF